MIKELFSSGIEGLGNAIGGVISQFKMAPADEAAANLQIQQLLQADRLSLEQTVRTEMGAKQKIMVAELQQSDNFTKRARPAVVYAGLIMSFAYLVSTIVQPDAPRPELPPQFMLSWSAICTTWVIGRTAEKRGNKAEWVKAITG